MNSEQPSARTRARWDDLLLIGGLALLLRVGYLILSAANMGFEVFANFAPDSQFYVYVAQYLTEGHVRGPSVILMVGPGYGGVLAGLRILFGPSLLAPILLNVLLGALAAPMVYLLAWRLTDSRITACVAGLISACSLTAICFSSHVLTDVPLYTLYAAALYSFARGYQDDRRGWFVAAGLIAAAAAFIRASGQLAFPVLLLLACVLPLRPRYGSRWQLFSRAALSALVVGVAIFAWSLRNYVKEGQFVFTTLGALTMRHCLVAQAMADNDDVKIQEYRIQWGIEDGESDLARYRGAYDRARARVSQAWQDMPGKLVHYYIFNIDQNLRAPIDYVPVQIPSSKYPVRWINDVMWRYWGRTLAVLSLLGVIMLWLRGRGAAAWVLGTHYVVFTAFCGSSFWQGSRFHLTAEIAWAILVPYLIWSILLFLFRGLTRLWQRIVAPRSTTVP